MAKQAWRPGVLPWAARAARNGGLSPPTVATPTTFDPSAPTLDVPGRPVPVPAPGHTPGSCCFHLPAAGVLVTGDSLITAHPTTSRRGPQLISAMFQHDAEQATRSLTRLGTLAGDVIVPGHGPVHHGTFPRAAEQATHPG